MKSKIELEEIVTDNIKRAFKYTVLNRYLEETVCLLAEHGATETLLLAVILDQAIQNTQVRLETIAEEFGVEVATYIRKLHSASIPVVDQPLEHIMVYILDLIYHLETYCSHHNEDFFNSVKQQSYSFLQDSLSHIKGWRIQEQQNNLSLTTLINKLEKTLKIIG